MIKNKAALGRLAMVVMALIWGTSFVVLKKTLDSVPVFYTIAFRFTGAVVLLLIFGLKYLKDIDRKYLLGGAIMGVLLFLAYILQTYGLQKTTPGKNAFLTATYCVLVPFQYWIVSKVKPDKFNVTAGIICLAGIGLVSLDGDLSMGIGDLLTIFSGVFFGLHIIATAKYSQDRSVLLLTMIQFGVVAVLSWIFALVVAPVPRNVPTSTIAGIVYLSVMCTAVCFLLQTFAQKYTPPTSASILMSLESVFGVVVSMLFYGEVITIKVFTGFLLIFAAVIISETKLNFLMGKSSKK